MYQAIIIKIHKTTGLRIGGLGLREGRLAGQILVRKEKRQLVLKVPLSKAHNPNHSSGAAVSQQLIVSYFLRGLTSSVRGIWARMLNRQVHSAVICDSMDSSTTD